MAEKMKVNIEIVVELPEDPIESAAVLSAMEAHDIDIWTIHPRRIDNEVAVYIAFQHLATGDYSELCRKHSVDSGPA